MQKSLTVDLAGNILTFHLRMKLRAPVLRTHYRPFSSSKKANFSIILQSRKNGALVGARKIFQTGDRYAIYARKNERLFDIFTDSRPGEDALTLVLHAASRTARILLPEARNVPGQAVFDYPLDQLLIMSVLPRQKALLLHGCVAVKDARAFLFLGNSGAGKTTISRILDRNGFTVLSDDRVIVKKERGVFWAYGTPWSGAGRFYSSRKAPVKRIFFLGHGKENRLMRIAAQAASARLLSFSFVPYWDRALTALSLATAVELVGRLSCQRLVFRPDDSIAGFLSQKLI